MKRNKPWVVVGAAGMGFGTLLMMGGVAYWRYANTLPPYTPPPVSLPIPNAYDDYVAAAQVLQSTTKVRASHKPDAPPSELRAVAADSQPALKRLRQGFRHEYLTPPIRSFNVAFPELAQFRELARRLVTEGRAAELEGRLTQAMDSYLDGLRFGTDIPRGGPLIHALVGYAVQGIMMRPMEGTIDRLDGQTAARAARRMAELDRGRVGVPQTLADEREVGYASMVEMMRNARGSWKDVLALLGGGGGGGFSLQEVLMGIRFSFTPKAQILKEYRAYMDALIAHAEKHYHAQGAPPQYPSDPLLQLLVPVFDSVRFRGAVMDARWRVIRARLAARAYQAEHGSPAPSLQALVPRYLEDVPQDPFAPQPLVYRVKDGKALIYSRGPDGDDDGGKDLGSRVEESSNGDVITMGKAGQ